MRRIVASYQIATPLMLGGANYAPEFRLASFANVVRWWWRFLALGRYDGNAARAAFWEAVLFGWSAPPFGRKRVRFRLEGLTEGFSWSGPDIPGDLRNWSGINYLTAQAFRREGGRVPVKVGRFDVSVRVQDAFDRNHFANHLKALTHQERGRFLKARIDDADAEAEFSGQAGGSPAQAPAAYATAVETLVDALALIGLAGGLGARSRRGFGSLAVTKLGEADGGDSVGHRQAIRSRPADADAYAKRLRHHLSGRRCAELPPYTAYSTETSFDICARGVDTAHLMNEMGWAFQIYRSWGQENPRQSYNPRQSVPSDVARFHLLSGNNVSAPSWIEAGREKDNWYDRRFTHDHDDFYDGGNFRGRATDNRALFGLPHNYGQKEVGWAENNRDPAHRRRASPLFFHFHPLADATTAFLCMTAPATFAPSGARLHVRKRNDYRNLPPVDWTMLRNFAEFVRAPPGGAHGGENGGVVHTQYEPEAISF